MRLEVSIEKGDNVLAGSKAIYYSRCLHLPDQFYFFPVYTMI
jgi:hypothetical protein